MRTVTSLLQGLGSDPDALQCIFDHSPVGVTIIDADDQVVFLNRSQAHMDDFDPREVIGKIQTEVITKTNITHPTPKNPEPILGYIGRYRTYKGREINGSCWIYPIFKDGDFAGSICFIYPLLKESPIDHHLLGRPVTWADDGHAPSYPEIVGRNPLFLKAIWAIKYNADNTFPMMISGETGVGKELLAKLIHQLSSRRDKPYITINCAAIPATLLEGLLFGTVKGSFTGAIDRAGLFEEADGGVIYLDEIDSMPLDLQPKLLRAIQEMQVSRVGSARQIHLDVKVISSINASPQVALGSGKIRPDLFYRLAVVMINIPALRKRPDDLERLTRHFIQKYAAVLGKKEVRPEENLWRYMRGYHWPGNVRELEHLLAASMVMVTEGEMITLEHLPDHYAQAFTGYGPDGDALAGGTGLENGESKKRPGISRQDSSDQAVENDLIESLSAEKERLRECLIQARGNLSRAAKIMNISRQTFSYRALKHGLNYRNYKPRG